MVDLNEITALEAAEKISKREISSVELVQACLNHISRREDSVAAWQYLDPEFAIAEAQKADNQKPSSILHGVPFGVKDVINTKDMPTHYGSEIFANNVPSADAACVTNMRNSGAILMGKTVTTEFATYQWGKTRNPHNPDRTPGGSSSGSAAAVGDMMVPIAFGNQTAGSLIRPAAFCGVHAFKPTHGTVNLGGIFELVPRLDTLGYMGRSVDDLAAFYEIVRGNIGKKLLLNDLVQAPKVGICKTPYWNEAQPETLAALEEAANTFKNSGSTVKECVLPDHFNNLAETHATILCAGLARSMSDIHSNHADQISGQLMEMLDKGKATPPSELLEALSHADSCMMEFPSVLEGFDILLTPSAPGEAPEGWATGNPIFQIMWTLLQVPCLTLPWTTGPTGMPVGVQLIGRKGLDRQVLEVAKWLDNRHS